VIIDQYLTLMSRINGSEGTEMFRQVYALQEGETIDITQDGMLSCAVYVSGVLVMTPCLDQMAATVASLESCLKRCGWQATEVPSPGSVFIWAKALQADGGEHEHAGFVLDARWGMSHSDSERIPVKHKLLSADRIVRTYYSHPLLQPSEV